MEDGIDPSDDRWYQYGKFRLNWAAGDSDGRNSRLNQDQRLIEAKLRVLWSHVQIWDQWVDRQSAYDAIHQSTLNCLFEWHRLILFCIPNFLDKLVDQSPFNGLVYCNNCIEIYSVNAQIQTWWIDGIIHPHIGAYSSIRSKIQKLELYEWILKFFYFCFSVCKSSSYCKPRIKIN